MEPTSFELPIFAPVPAGHRVVVAGFRLTGGTSGVVDWLVVDRTAKVVYCDERLWGAIDGNPHVFDDPVGVVAQRGWILDRSATGRSAGTMSVSPRAARSSKTLLFVEPGEDAPYR